MGTEARCPLSVRMPELRRDPLVDRWVIVATERAKRPMEFRVARDEPQPEGVCPFCVQGTGPTTKGFGGGTGRSA